MNELTNALIQKIRDEQPLIHCITNTVVANFQANGLLALGASPVMADAIEEAAEIASISSCTVLNIGTLKHTTVEAMLVAGRSANEQGIPVVLDPVGAGATSFRKESVLRLLDNLNVTLIRCNAGELMAIADVNWEAKGVDAGEGDADIEAVAKQVALQHGCLVAITGPEDLVTDGESSIRVSGGDPIMTQVTGMGCLLSAVTGAFLAVAAESRLEAVACGLSFYKEAGKKAATYSEGPGDFAIRFLNGLADPFSTTNTGGCSQ